ncbi:uncharacterized protein DS421_3g105340 [Arachis hypogaea]|nr:uncharacterized protein DS421_3g105340 [Arachis hypogaea]
MARTKNTKRGRVEGESSASVRLVASSHYMARNDYYPNLVRAVYSTLNYVVPEPDEESEEVMPLIVFDLGSQHYRVTLQELAEQWNLVYHGAKFTGGIGVDEKWGEYNRLVSLQSLQYENPQMDARGYACHWTKIFTWLRIDLSEEKSVVLSNVAKIDDSTLRQMGRDPNAQEPQVQGQPQDPEVQAQSQEPHPPPPPPSPTMRDLMDEL